MQSISFSKCKYVPSEINNMIFDFAGSNNFYAINWVCRNWQKDLLESKVDKAAKHLFSNLVYSNTQFNYKEIGLALDPKNKKNAMLKLLSLKAIEDIDENLVTKIINKISISFEISPQNTDKYHFSFVFAYGNQKIEFASADMDFKILNVFHTIYVKKSYSIINKNDNLIIGEFDVVDSIHTRPNEIRQTLIKPFYPRLLAHVGSLITPEFNRDPEPITSFKDFFAYRVFRIQDCILS